LNKDHHVIVIADYNPAWPVQYEALARTVAAALGSVLLRIEHVGSTAVQGLAAKPIIDMDAVVRAEDIPEAIRRLKAIGYIYKGDQGIVGRETFRTTMDATPHHLYVCPPESLELRAHLHFRDMLRANPVLMMEYAELKRALAIRFGTDRAGYCEAKTSFVKNVLHTVRVA
jgi:GrpB-like predicted nucleotidyltransferase (UPF0157 family)